MGLYKLCIIIIIYYYYYYTIMNWSIFNSMDRPTVVNLAL